MLSIGDMFNSHVTDFKLAGSTVRIAPHFLITADPDLLKKMNAVRGTFTRSEWYTALRLHPTRDNITSTIDEGVHASIRSKMAPGVSSVPTAANEEKL